MTTETKCEACERLAAYLQAEYDQVTASLAKGKGEWPKKGYVRDEVWARWRARRTALACAIREATGEYPEDYI